MVGRRVEATLVPPYRFRRLNKAIALRRDEDVSLATVSRHSETLAPECRPARQNVAQINLTILPPPRPSPPRGGRKSEEIGKLFRTGSSFDCDVFVSTDHEERLFCLIRALALPSVLPSLIPKPSRSLVNPWRSRSHGWQSRGTDEAETSQSN